ncbi:hypothetical protein D3C87_1887730 [compost metagenome]
MDNHVRVHQVEVLVFGGLKSELRTGAAALITWVGKLNNSDGPLHSNFHRGIDRTAI